MAIPKSGLGRHSKQIIHVELKWFNNQPRLGLYLDVSTNPILDLNGNEIPLTSEYRERGFKDETSSVKDMGFTPSGVIAKQKNLKYVHLFILNNRLGGKGITNQRKYYDNMVRTATSGGIDLRKANSINVQDWEKILQAAWDNKMLVADWAQWWTDAGPFAGPDGEDMSIA